MESYNYYYDKRLDFKQSFRLSFLASIVRTSILALKKVAD